MAVTASASSGDWSAAGQSAALRRISRFDERYGPGAYLRLQAALANPDRSFADIAVEFGVTRERVRQWRNLWAPEIPTGRRRRLIAHQRARRRRALRSPLVRAFITHARPHLTLDRITLLPTRYGFRTQRIRVDGREVALRDVWASLARTSDAAVTCRLAGVRGAAFVYVRLPADAYLLLPASALAAHGARFVDEPSHRFQRYVNTFRALLD